MKTNVSLYDNKDGAGIKIEPARLEYAKKIIPLLASVMFDHGISKLVIKSSTVGLSSSPHIVFKHVQLEAPSIFGGASRTEVMRWLTRAFELWCIGSIELEPESSDLGVLRDFWNKTCDIKPEIVLNVESDPTNTPLVDTLKEPVAQH